MYIYIYIFFFFLGGGGGGDNRNYFLFSKDALYRSKVTEKTGVMMLKIQLRNHK